MERITLSSLDQERLAFFARSSDFISGGGGGGGPRGNQWCRREIPCGDEAGDFYRHRQTLVARGQALQLWKNARVSLSSPIAPGSGVTSRDCPNLRGSQVTTPPTGELACMLIPTLIL